jgi:hypothetical protein
MIQFDSAVVADKITTAIAGMGDRGQVPCGSGEVESVRVA